MISTHTPPPLSPCLVASSTGQLQDLPSANTGKSSKDPDRLPALPAQERHRPGHRAPSLAGPLDKGQRGRSAGGVKGEKQGGREEEGIRGVAERRLRAAPGREEMLCTRAARLAWCPWRNLLDPLT